ncbi:MAG: 1-acyl-sn-glycerol-3-phosphate acyltransferase [Saprospiraceae bacterium]|nr:1-acyl-sn-glycerol-3-phosphate acyltransferase [Saprospiraceae bacterium]
MNPVLYLVYRLLQGMAILGNEVYFRKIHYINKQYLSADGPLVVICNHPNTVVDPLLAIMYAREPVFLLANYSLFKNPIAGAILRTLFCIPVKRVKDVAERENRDNDDAFRKSEQHLKEKRSIFLAAEGSSYTERHIRTFKTGAARILFAAESQSDFKLNVRILPVGLTYFDPLKFGSDVVVEVGAPFSAADWKDRYAQNPQETVNNFMQYIEDKFHDLTIHCENVKEDHFLQKLEAVIQSEKPLDTEGVYFRSKKILMSIQEWKKSDATGFKVFEQQVETYFSRLKTLKLKDVKTEKFSVSKSLGLCIVGFPAFIIGLIPNFIPAWIANGLVRWLKLDSAYDTTVRLIFGFFLIFPMLYWIETELFCAFLFPNLTNISFFQTILLIVFYITSGLLAWRVYTEGGRFLNFQKYKRANSDGSLTAMRQPILDVLN